MEHGLGQLEKVEIWRDGENYEQSIHDGEHG